MSTILQSSSHNLIKFGVTVITALFVPIFTYYLISQLDKRKNEYQDKGNEKLRKHLTDKQIKQLNVYEIEIASTISYKDHNTSFTMIGGMDDILRELKLKILMPFIYLNESKLKINLISPSSGVLFYGKPGCGKTLITRAIANEIDCPLILFDFSIVLDKWYGETEKLIKALFTLAYKIQPCIIFIDEIDCLLQTRSQSDHEVTSRIKSIFLTEMDGYLDNCNNRILVIGATNRIDILDKAILRRFPNKYVIPAPDEKERLKILAIFLADVSKSPDLDLNKIAEITSGYTGSDLKDLCRSAIFQSLYKHYPAATLNFKEARDKVKPLYNDVYCINVCQDDFLQAFSSHTICGF